MRQPSNNESCLNAATLRRLLHYDLDTGIFRWRVDRCVGRAHAVRTKAGSVAGCYQYGYVLIPINRRNYRAHRLAWLWMTGQWPAEHIDHKNRDRGDNRWVNLRLGGDGVNERNHSLPRNNRSGFVGVSRTPYGTFQASIRVNRHNHHLGTFKTIDAAIAARAAAAQRYGFDPSHGQMIIR
jgi:hypothetical protein